MTQSNTQAFEEPKLPWPKDALAKKGISQETIEYHYGKHHLGYVRKLNIVAQNDNKVAKSTIEQLIKTRFVNCIFKKDTHVKTYFFINIIYALTNHKFIFCTLAKFVGYFSIFFFMNFFFG